MNETMLSIITELGFELDDEYQYAEPQYSKKWVDDDDNVIESTLYIVREAEANKVMDTVMVFDINITKSKDPEYMDHQDAMELSQWILFHKESFID